MWEDFTVVHCCFGYLNLGVMLVRDSGHRNPGSSEAVGVELTCTDFSDHQIMTCVCCCPASDNKGLVMNLTTAFLYRLCLI